MSVKLKRRARAVILSVAILGLIIFALAQLDWLAILDHSITFVNAQQRVFHDQMATNMRAIKETHSWLATLALVAMGFLYGVFHALGPCHDKMVVTGYMLANDRSIRRGMIITLLASLLQAVTAMVLVLGLFYFLGFARYQAEHIASLLEMGSFLFVMLLGAGLIFQSIQQIWHLRHPTAAHVHDEHCSHGHMPDVGQITRAKNFRELAIITLSLGIRPCSGAVLLLIFACILGTIGAGIAATFAMALGSAFTTAMLALTAVQSKNWALRFFKFSESDLAATHAGLGIMGGIIVMLMGGVFLFAAWQEQTTSAAVENHPLWGMHSAQPLDKPPPVN